ncbi:hypothetical protein [Nocardiopsis synnemataformans]|uniref:hypothetical protein n=1 Tax=Nocardiopsis synnemataformans TaxID=61305 RepID=UPI003EB78F7F
MSSYITARAASNLAHTETELAGRLAALQSTVAAWTTDSVNTGATMNAASLIAELATLAARRSSQQETLTLLKAAEAS